MSISTDSKIKVPRREILVGDAVEQMQQLPEASIDCVITSPPYFRLRNYEVDGQLGLEGHVDQWVEGLRTVAKEVARVLVPTGTLWLNVGDSYATHAREGAPRKSLLAGPERLLMALIEDGWIVRNKIVWAKTNPIPSSVGDRLSTTHEVIYLLSRNPRYYFDLDAVRVPHKTRPPKRGTEPTRPAGRSSKAANVQRPAWLGPNSDGDAGLTAMQRDGRVGHPLGGNPGDVWAMSTSRYKGAHFATYPEHLIQRMVLAGCPEARCKVCRVPWSRPVRRLCATATRLALRSECEHANTPEPGLVLDPFLGSGTTAVVAERLGRDWLGIELSPTFADLARHRLTETRKSPHGDKRTSKRKEVI